jgi:hypothetical protein
MRKVGFALLGFWLLAGTLALAAEKGAWTGVVSDSNCATSSHANDAACVAKCIGGGAKAVLVTPQKDVLEITNPDTIKGSEGKTVKVTGSLDGKQLTVDKVEMAKAGAKPAQQH